MNMNYKMEEFIMSLEKNTDICVLVDVDVEEKEIIVYSPLERKNITVSITEEVLENIEEEDQIAFEIDLDTNNITQS